MTSRKNTQVIITIKNAKGSEVIINSFCTVVRTSISGLTFPNSNSAMVARRMSADQMRRWLFFGSILPLSVNMLNTNTAESSEVTRNPIRSIIVIAFRTVGIG